jgi:hypothetical protein
VRAAKRSFTGRGGRTIEGPLLVPSISSRGFDFVKTEDEGTLSRTAGFLRSAAPNLANGTVLISAYDIHYGFLPDCAALRTNALESVYGLPGLTFIDSGLYEWRRDPRVVVPEAGASREWNRSMLEETLDGLDDALDAVVVNFELAAEDDASRSPSSFHDQITAASEFFTSRQSRFASDCLLKADRANRLLEVGRLTATDIGRLGAFDIIGVAEKDLGGRIVDRLVAVAALRDALTRGGLGTKPIHVFGALDPLFTPLFFAAGADIFDGLGWLRYAYQGGVGVYRESPSVLSQDRYLGAESDRRLAMVQQDNIGAMHQITSNLKRFAESGEWDIFGTHAIALDDMHRAMTAEMKGSGGS